MGDQVTSWDKLYALGLKFGFNKAKVDSIVNSGRGLFSSKTAASFPDWKQKLTDKATALGIDLTPTPAPTNPDETSPADILNDSGQKAGAGQIDTSNSNSTEKRQVIR